MRVIQYGKYICFPSQNGLRTLCDVSCNLNIQFSKKINENPLWNITPKRRNNPLPKSRRYLRRYSHYRSHWNFIVLLKVKELYRLVTLYTIWMPRSTLLSLHTQALCEYTKTPLILPTAAWYFIKRYSIPWVWDKVVPSPFPTLLNTTTEFKLMFAGVPCWLSTYHKHT